MVKIYHISLRKGRGFPLLFYQFAKKNLRLREEIQSLTAGVDFLEELLERCRREGVALVLSGVHAQPMLAMRHAGLLEELGEANALVNIDLALERARRLLGLESMEAPSSPGGLSSAQEEAMEQTPAQ